MKMLILILIITASPCYAQQDEYQTKLTARLRQIRELRMFNNSAVVYDESTAYGSIFHNGNRMKIITREIVCYLRRKCLKLLMHSINRSPELSGKEWQLLPFSIPYLFLRDTAKIDDLTTLQANDHPYIRVYSFATLVYREQKGLFQIVLNHLSDKTMITEITGDVGRDVFPADLMLTYCVGSFNKDQKDSLNELILHKYNYLITLDKAMYYYQPLSRSK